MRGIITADWHLRSDKPICRLDEDWIEKQKQDVTRIVRLAKERECPIYIIGDIFDTPRVTPEIEQLLPRILMEYGVDVYLIAGNHDLRFNAIEYLDKCSIGTLLCCNHIHQLHDTDEFMFKHVLVFRCEKEMPPNVKAITASELLEKYPDKRIIFTGDMHQSFLFSECRKYVVNPGCMNIQVGNMKDYECGVWYVNTDTNQFEWIATPDDPTMVTNEHNIIKREKAESIGAFIEYMKTQKEHSFDFWYILGQKQQAVNNPAIDELVTTIKETVKD